MGTMNLACTLDNLYRDPHQSNWICVGFIMHALDLIESANLMMTFPCANMTEIESQLLS